MSSSWPTLTQIDVDVGAPSRGTVVVDASALITMLITPGEAGEAVATRLIGTHPVAPHLLPFEVSNVLRRRRNAGLLSEAEASLALSGFARLPVELWPFEALGERVWRHGRNLSSYDAAYVALAEHLRCPLLTSDARIARAPGLECTVEVFA